MILLAVAFAVIAVIVSGGSGSNEPDIAGLPCERGERLDYHVHSRLSIFAEGEPVVVPQNVGVVPGECIYWLHTHDSEGLIHVEAPEELTFTLGQFFALWGQPLTDRQFLDKPINAEHSLRATVNGQAFDGDPAEIELSDQAVIVLEYGPPFQARSVQ